MVLCGWVWLTWVWLRNQRTVFLFVKFVWNCADFLYSRASILTMIITMVIFVEDDNQGCLPHYVAAIYHMGGLSQCGAQSVCHWVSLYKLHNGSLHGAVIAFCGLNTMMAIKVCRTSLP